jgi:SAM-dependent methyltransferase
LMPESGSTCPLCGGTGREWRRKRGFDLRLCESCDNAFVPPSLVPADLEELYSATYFEGGADTGYPSYLADRSIIAKNFSDRLAFIGELVPPGRRLLDVGAAYGLFMKVARDAGFDVKGVEIAEDCAAEAARISGAPVIAGDFVSVELHGSFDVIVMLDVIEHMRDPLAGVKRAHELLAPNGLLIVETGDHRSLWARLLGNRWYFLDPPQHLFYFSRSGLGWLLRRGGFERTPALRRLGRRVSLRNVSFKLAKEAPERWRERVSGLTSAGLPGHVYLNFGDGMLIGARRAATR